MVDPFKSIATLAQAKSTARVADAAAREMARHCDSRIKKMLQIVDELVTALEQVDHTAGDMGNSTAAGRCGDVGRIARAAVKSAKARLAARNPHVAEPGRALINAATPEATK